MVKKRADFESVYVKKIWLVQQAIDVKRHNLSAKVLTAQNSSPGTFSVGLVWAVVISELQGLRLSHRIGDRCTMSH